MDRATLRIHHLLPASRANGPGLRAVLWTQGCTLACPGCFNPETHDPGQGETVKTADLLMAIRSIDQPIEGLTVSGGEPLQQIHPLVDLLARVRRETPLSILLFTGYRWDEIQAMPAAPALLASLDVLIAGRYQADARLARGLIGSTNKTVHFLTARYSPADLRDVAPAEVTIGVDGTLTLSGIDPLSWR